MNDAETTPTGIQPITDEVDLAVREVSTRLKEIGDALRAGQVRLGGMSGLDRAAFVRNAAARLRDVERFAGFAATLFEEEFVEPLVKKFDTPRNLEAFVEPKRLGSAVKLLGALAAILGAAAGLWRAITGRAPGP